MAFPAIARRFVIALLLLASTACGQERSDEARPKPVPPRPKPQLRVFPELRPLPPLREAVTVATVRGSVSEFAQDGPTAAWIRTAATPCGWTVELFTFGTKRIYRDLNRVRCSSNVDILPDETIAVAGTDVLWVEPSGSNNSIYRDFVRGFPGSRGTTALATAWPGEGAVSEDQAVRDPPLLVAGDGDAFVFYAYSEPVGLDGGVQTDGVWKLSGGRATNLTSGPVDALALDDGRAATVSASDGKLEIRRLTDGHVIGTARRTNQAIALALGEQFAVALTPGLSGSALEVFAANAKFVRRIDLTGDVTGPISISGPRVALTVGDASYVLDVDAMTSTRVVARPAVGFSIEGDRLAWAESVGGQSRIRVVDL